MSSLSGIKKLIGLFMPELCSLCGEPIEYGREGAFCRHCITKWEMAKRLARYDAAGGIPAVDFTELHDEHFGRAIYTAYYDPSEHESVTDMLVFKLKQNCTSAVLDFAVGEYIGMLRDAAPEIFNSVIKREEIIVTWIPRRPEAVAKYGYDHMECVSRLLSERCGFECRQLIFRDEGSAEQKTLSSKKRYENVESSMRIGDPELSGRTIIMLDDLITTGASMKFSCSLLAGKGAKTVIAAALLRAKNY